MNAWMAFFHHLAAFTIALTLFAEMLLLAEPLTLASARKIQRFDALYGMSAGLILVLGFLRVMYFEKGPAYYSHSGPFMAKMGLFVLIGLISIYPTMVFLKWGKSLKQGIVPELSLSQKRKLRGIIHLELTLLVLVILSAALMAKGIGYFGA
ncbi:DUF2214 family protein [Undibacterium terreum]|uniref:Membrane protein n=1 Tax=Undibacterium terreum TaxID=1224302 RepID=A0A916UI97_9BURK|nr:DUF2214 family protein [Undibacterium terreum]GGC73911.1 membrane protein [Undibacterium terreum]